MGQAAVSRGEQGVQYEKYLQYKDDSLSCSSRTNFRKDATCDENLKRVASENLFDNAVQISTLPLQLVEHILKTD